MYNKFGQKASQTPFGWAYSLNIEVYGRPIILATIYIGFASTYNISVYQFQIELGKIIKYVKKRKQYFSFYWYYFETLVIKKYWCDWKYRFLTYGTYI